MGRTLSSAMQTAISANTGYADVWFVEILGSGTSIRYTTLPNDVSWNSQTWTGIGGLIEIDAPPESADPGGQSCNISFSGVNQTIIAEVLTNQVRGRSCVIYWGQILISSGAVIVDPITIFDGMLNSRWTMEEQPSDHGQRGTVKVSTAAVSDMARNVFTHAVYTNWHSLQNMQNRAYNKITLSANPITTTSGSIVITVANTNEPHRIGIGDQVTLASATDTGGITAARLNVMMEVVTTPSEFSYTADIGGSNATSGATGGGTGVIGVYGHDLSAIVNMRDYMFNTLPDLVGQPIYWGRKGAQALPPTSSGYQPPGVISLR